MTAKPNDPGATTSKPTTPPDPARAYERAIPEAESGMGRLDNNTATPENNPDAQQQAVKNRQAPRQVNAEDVTQARADANAPEAKLPPPQKVDHSMMEEEPDGWDLAPQDIHDPRTQRHPRREGKGGTP